MRRAWPALALTLVLACARRPPEPPSPLTAWVGTFVDAQQAAGRGEFARADSILARFGRAFPASNEAAESQFWRALYRLHPANEQFSPRTAIRDFDRYLSLGEQATRQAEAVLLRTVATRLDSLLTRSSQTRPADAPATDSTATQEEVARLRAELRRTTEELERMRRRLAQPRP